MDIGIGLWCLQSTATNPRSFGRAYQELTEDAQLAEQHGIHSLWLSEHHGYYDGYCPALMPAASAALAATETLQVGTGVLLLPLHEPQRVANAANHLNQQFPERFHLGVGMGYRPIEFEMKDRHMSQRLKLMTSGLDTLSTKTDTPTWIGISSEQAAERAGRRGLGLFISGAFSKEVVNKLIAAHRAAWEKSEPKDTKPPPVGLLRNLWIVDTEEEQRQALNWVRSSYLVYAGLGWGADNTGVDFVSEIETSMNEVEKSATVGSAEQIAEDLSGYDVDLVVCRIGYDQPPRSALTDVIERIGTELVPLAREF
ncbi:MAG: LLM class flavin-dependent oxidoreductase [Actinomycetota bacterium]|nr:LLM class flavin-dependent oxidoreductase [Actinomycetota bacterium]